MIIVMGTAKASPETLQSLVGAMETMVTATRLEEGCIDYAYSIEVGAPAVLRISERWENMEALVAHFGAPHMQEFQKALAANPPGELDIKFYEASEVTLPGA
jgi:quinol monooxygenase YgiN